MALGRYTMDEHGNKLKARIELYMSQGMFAIVEADTRVEYSNQVGGTCCAHPVVEGHLVPMSYLMSGIDVADELYKATQDLWGPHTYEDLEKYGKLEEVRRLVAHCQPTAYDGQWCVLDEERMKTEKCGEAWLPINTPMGRGWLTWENSD